MKVNRFSWCCMALQCNLPKFQHLERKHISLYKALLSSYIFVHFCLHTPQEAFMTLNTPGFLCTFHFDHPYMLLKSTESVKEYKLGGGKGGEGDSLSEW